MQKLLLVYYHAENGGVLSMRMQIILDSSFARPDSAPIWVERKESSGTGLWEYLRKMERHFSIKPSQPIEMAVVILNSFTEFPN